MFQVKELIHIIQDSQILLSSTKINLGGKELNKEVAINTWWVLLWV